MSLRSTSSKASSSSRTDTLKSSTSTATTASSTGTFPASAAAIRRRVNAVQGPWADEPFPLLKSPSKKHDIRHPAIYVADEMTSQHNAALRGLNAIYLQAPYVQAPEDITDLLFLMQCWGLWVQYHHDLRRTRVFPKFEEALQKPGYILSQLTKDTHFVPMLNRLLSWVQEIHPQAELYDPLIFRELIMDFGTIFRAHLTHLIWILTEIPYTCGQPGSPESETRAAKLSQLYRLYQKEADDAMDPNIVPPMIVRMRDTTYEGGNNWPGLSLVAVHTIDERLSKAHSGAWRFLPCNVWGKPKEVPFRGPLDGQAIPSSTSVPQLPPKSPARKRKLPTTSDASANQQKFLS